MSASDPLLDPVGAVAAVVRAADPSLDPAVVRQVVERVGGGRAKRRRLATALAENPSVLVTGRSPAPRVVGDLLLALRVAGPTEIASPHCAACDREITSMQIRGEDWYCSPCFVRPQACAACGHERQVAFRDRHGQPRCGGCRDQDPGDPLAGLVGLVTSIDPGLTPQAVERAISATVTKTAHVQKLAWAIAESPALLTGEGARAPFPMLLRLIDALIDAGGTALRRPACPRCGRVVTLSKKADGLRICRNCCARIHAVPCSRCGSIREPAARDADGQPLCPFCLVNDPINREECTRCGRRRWVHHRSEQGPVCAACALPAISTCSVCGRLVPCRTSTITGQPWCPNCSRSWAVCSGCGVLAPVRAGTRTAPLCAACITADPAIWKPCPSCGETGRLVARICIPCHLRRRLDELLTDRDGRVRPELGALHAALASHDRPATALRWLSHDTTTSVLASLANGERPLTHVTLDELPQTKTLAHLRAVLVATGALAVRDEHLAQLEVWVDQAVAARSDPDERQLLHRYAVWHLLRRLRERTRTTHTTPAQATVVRANIGAAAAFLDWLDAHQLTLGTCTQLDLDRWMTRASQARRGHTGHFVRWARKQKQTTLDFPATAWTGPAGALDTEGRWEQARRLLHDTTIPPEHRVAGLLVLLYAQRAAILSRLVIDDVIERADEVMIRLGREPIVLPEPIADLVRQLLVDRKGHAKIASQTGSPWLFPGGRPGQPISSFQLVERLRGIGVYPGQARSTALYQLAGELPAAILARLLGIHISAAVKWQRAAGGDWTNYAAEVSRR